MVKIDHIGIAVNSLADSVPVYEKLLGTPCYKSELVALDRVNTAFFKLGESKIELLESVDPEGVIARFIQKKGEGVHHIAYEVTHMDTEIARLKKEGFVLIDEKPRMGADNKLICFLHPKKTGGVLVELCMEAPVAG